MVQFLIALSFVSYLSVQVEDERRRAEHLACLSHHDSILLTPRCRCCTAVRIANHRAFQSRISQWQGGQIRFEEIRFVFTVCMCDVNTLTRRSGVDSSFSVQHNREVSVSTADGALPTNAEKSYATYSSYN